MSQKYVTNLDLNKLQLQNAVVHPLGTAPASPVVGQVYFDTAALSLRTWNGSAWDHKATDSALLNGQNAAYYLSRANHTGTQLAATISDFTASVTAIRLDQLTAPTTNVSFGSNRIINVADPVNPQDAATMGWVQTQVQSSAAGIDAKASVRLATTANITLSGLAAIDGVTPVAGDRILVKNQTTASANGVYIAAAGSWTRATDADATGEITPGAFWFVEEGTTNAKTQWRVENTGTITLGTTAITINQFGAGSVYTGSSSILLTGNAFSVIVQASGGLTSGGSGLAIDTTIVARKYSTTIGDGSATSFTVTHNLGTQDVITTVREVSTNAVVIADVTNSGTNAITVAFGFVPAASSYRVTVLG